MDIIGKNFLAAKKDLRRLNDFYGFLWSKAINLKPEERKKAEELSEQLSGLSDLARAHHHLSKGFLILYLADFNGTIKEVEQSAAFYNKLQEDGGEMMSYTLMAVSYRSMGQLDKAHTYLQMALKKAENKHIGEPYYNFYSITYYQAGELMAEGKNYEEAIVSFNTGLSYAVANAELSGRLHCGLGTVYMNTGQWEKSIHHLQTALGLIDKSNQLLISKVYYDISNYHYKRKEYDQALENQHKSLDIRLGNNMLNPATTSYVLMAEIYFSQGNFAEAIRYGELGAAQAEKLNTIIKLFEAHEILSKAYEAAGNIEKAFDHYKKFQKYRSEVHNQETIKKIEQLTSRHKMESVQNEKEIFRLRNVELKAAFDEIEMKQNEILDSIRYAQRIQKALLTNASFIEKTLNRLNKN